MINFRKIISKNLTGFQNLSGLDREIFLVATLCVLFYSVGGKHTATDMGSGEFPAAGYGKAAYQRSLQYMDINQNILDVVPDTTIVNDSLCYDIAHTHNVTWGRHFYYGGEGYNDPNCE